MKNIAKIVVCVSVLTLCVGSSFAQGKKAAPAKPAKCSACGMTLSAKKTKACPVAVKVKGKVVGYCCAGCKMK